MIEDPIRSSARRMGRPTMEGNTVVGWLLDLYIEDMLLEGVPCSGKFEPA